MRPGVEELNETLVFEVPQRRGWRTLKEAAAREATRCARVSQLSSYRSGNDARQHRKGENRERRSVTKSARSVHTGAASPRKPMLGRLMVQCRRYCYDREMETKTIVMTAK